MGILSTHPTLVPGQKIIVSEDKDMKTIPGWLFNPGKDTKPRLIGEPEADYWHMYQTIVGDSTDGYKGAPGAGPKAAERVLRAKDGAYLTTKHMWQGVIEVFASKGLEEADALQQAQVARICRHTDYDFTNKRAVPWTPEEKA